MIIFENGGIASKTEKLKIIGWEGLILTPHPLQCIKGTNLFIFMPAKFLFDFYIEILLLKAILVSSFNNILHSISLRLPEISKL